MSITRRSVFGRASCILGTLGLVGCIGQGSDTVESKFRLKSFDVEAPTLADHYLLEDPLSRPANTFVDYTPGFKQEVLDRLFDAGEVSVNEWQLTYTTPFGDRSNVYPVFLERDGTYYRVHLEDKQSREVTRWQFYVDWLDGESPGKGDRISPPFESLSSLDRRILKGALDAVYANRSPPLDNSDDEGVRAVSYHADLDANESDLVPSPPFEYVQYNDETYRAVTEETTETVIERTFTIESVAESRSEFVSHVRSRLPVVDFADVSLSEDSRTVLETATDVDTGRAYEEKPPLSEKLEGVLEHLNVAPSLKSPESYESRVQFAYIPVRVQGAWYEFTLLVYP